MLNKNEEKSIQLFTPRSNRQTMTQMQEIKKIKRNIDKILRNTSGLAFYLNGYQSQQYK